MKEGFLGSTALVGAMTLLTGTAAAAEAPTWKLTGNANFQFYWVDQDMTYLVVATTGGPTGSVWTSGLWGAPSTGPAVTASQIQKHDWYFGVDESELQLNVSGAADNGLNYGFKIEINSNTTDGTVADEARLQFSGGWGTLQMGDEDGAEDIMNYGGENLMGATGGFDGDFDDVLGRAGLGWTDALAQSYPKITGDTSDATKVSYFSPRFSGFQIGASLTPQPGLSGDDFKQDGDWENHIGIGANYDNSFGDMRVRASAVYSAASSNSTGTEDISAYSIGGIVGFGPVSIGGNYTDNGDSGQPTGSVFETSYWNVAASFEAGPLYLSSGYMASAFKRNSGIESTFETVSLTADYSVAPGLGVYAEVDLISDEPDNGLVDDATNDATIFLAGANVGF